MTAEIGIRPVAATDVVAALGRVHDPELDEPITDLQFVADVRLLADGVEVDLRLPTYFCAPNFAYLMVADAWDEVSALPGSGQVTIRLLEHFASEEINAGISGGLGFQGSFPGLANDELAELRRTFTIKAHRACQERVASPLVKAGADTQQLASSTLADGAPGPDLDRLVRRRHDLGLPAGPDAPLLLGDDGTPITVAELPLQLRFARTTRVSIEGNSSFCRGLLAVRYDLPTRPDGARSGSTGAPVRGAD